MRMRVLKIAFSTLFLAWGAFAGENALKIMSAQSLNYNPLGFSLGLGALERPKQVSNTSEKLMDLSHLPDCQGGTLSTLSPQVKGVIDLSFDAFLKDSCEKLRGYQINRFTKAQCEAAVECKNIIKNKSEESAEKIDAVLNKIIAKDFAKNTLINGAPEKESEAVAELMKEEDFKKADVESRAQMFLATIGKDAEGKWKDPILHFDLSLLPDEGDFKNSPLFKKLMASKEKNIKKVFEDYRKERAARIADEFVEKMLEKAQLSDEEKCKDVSAFKNICADVSALLKGNRANVKNAALLESLSSRKRMDESEAEALKSVLGTDLDPSDLETMINARRCLSFTLETTGEPLARGSSKDRTPLLPDFRLPSTGVSESSYGSSLPSSSGPAGDYLGAARSGGGVYSEGQELGVGGEVYPPYNGGGYLPSIGGGMIPQTSSGSSSSGSSASSAGAVVEAPKNNPAAQGADLPAGLENKISTLEKQLKEAREQLEKLEKDKEKKAQEDDAREREKDKAEMKKMIAELEAQVKAAKETFSQRPASARKEAEEDDQDFGPADRGDSSRSVVIDDYYRRPWPPVNRGSAPERAEGMREGHSEESEGDKGKGPSSLSTLSLSSKGNSPAANSSSSVVILDLGGLSKDNANALILNQIKESNNRPFLITVNNEVKEVVPYSENGQVLFKTIVRGKIGDTNFPAWKFKVTSKELPEAEKKKRSGAYQELNKTLENGLNKN